MNSKCKTIAIINQKGGVGKTTTTYNLGWELGNIGKKVLIVDLDSQANLTMLAGIKQPDNLDRNISHLMIESIKEQEKINPKEVIIKLDLVDLLPSSNKLAELEIMMLGILEREYVLDDVLNEFRDEYDYILIDCLPALGLLSVNAMATADSVIIPVTAEFLAVKGMESLIKSIVKIKKRINPKLEIEGILKSRYKENLILTKQMNEAVEDNFGKVMNIFDVIIPEASKMGDAALNGLSVRQIASNRKYSNKEPLMRALQAYENLAKIIITD